MRIKASETLQETNSEQTTYYVYGYDFDNSFKFVDGADGNGVYDDVVEATDKLIGPKETEVLLDSVSGITGNNRKRLLSVVQDGDLNNIVNELYRPGATVGDGGTASKLAHEFYEGS